MGEKVAFLPAIAVHQNYWRMVATAAHEPAAVPIAAPVVL
jgi:hypothetical protein